MTAVYVQYIIEDCLEENLPQLSGKQFDKRYNYFLWASESLEHLALNNPIL